MRENERVPIPFTLVYLVGRIRHIRHYRHASFVSHRILIYRTSITVIVISTIVEWHARVHRDTSLIYVREGECESTCGTLYMYVLYTLDLHVNVVHVYSITLTC